MTRDLVSIIIPVYNRPRLLVEAVESALAQTYRPIEVIVVDDGSTDETADVAQRFAAQHADIIRYARVPHGGVALAMNEGLRLAAGEFIQILDSDDLLLPEKLTLQVAGLRTHPDCGISYGYAREYVLGEPWSGRPSRRTGETFDELFPAILADKIWPAPVPLFRRAVVDRIGEFCDVSVHTEWEFECRAAALRVRLHHCRDLVSDTRGVHHLEGRRKGAVDRAQLDDYAKVLEMIWQHAQQVSVPAPAMDQFARRLFAVARRCAAAGLEPSSRRCLELANTAATRLRTRRQIAWYSAAAGRVGWRRTGQLVLALERSAIVSGYRAIRRRPRAIYDLWTYRAAVALETVSGQSITRWPALLKQKWANRESARPQVFQTRS